MIIKVGTLVLCHLIIAGTNPQANQGSDQEQKITKMSGIVTEIHEESEIVSIDNYSVKRAKPMLVVEPDDKDKVFKVSATACRPVIDEETYQSILKQKEEMKKKSSKTVKKSSPSPQLEESPSPDQNKPANDLSESEKERLLKELEK